MRRLDSQVARLSRAPKGFSRYTTRSRAALRTAASDAVVVVDVRPRVVVWGSSARPTGFRKPFQGAARVLLKDGNNSGVTDERF